MTNLPIDVRRLENTSRTRSSVKSLARELVRWTPKHYEQVIRELMDSGNDKALGILLNGCAVNQVKLAPAILVPVITVVDQIDDYIYPFKYQDRKAIPLLLKTALNKQLTAERMVLTGTIACELTVLHGYERKPVEQLIKKLQTFSVGFHLSMVLKLCLQLLNSEEPVNSEKSLINWEVLDKLPERNIRTVAWGGLFTVKRPVAKLGRNNPCHCGSGKKYKKCCYEKDRESLSDPIRNSPEFADSIELIESMRAYELEKLVPANLSSDQLVCAYHRTKAFKLYRLSLDCLIELKNRPDENEFCMEHFDDLLHIFLYIHECDLALETRGYIPHDHLDNSDLIDFKLALLRNREIFQTLEDRCCDELKKTDRLTGNGPLMDVSYCFENLFPALNVIFSRAAIIENYDGSYDVSDLRDNIRTVRSQKDFKPHDDPIEDLYALYLKKDRSDSVDASKDKQIKELKEKTRKSRQLAAETAHELRKRNAELRQLTQAIEAREKKQALSAQKTSLTGDPPPPDYPQIINSLKQKNSNLTLEIQNQQTLRKELRSQLKEERRKQRKQGSKHFIQGKQADDSLFFEVHELPKRILFPEYSDQFKRTCDQLPSPLVAKALAFITGFASLDPAVLKHTKQIESKSDLFRIRLGRQYRIMIHWEKNVCIKPLDIINRANFDTWLKQFHSC